MQYTTNYSLKKPEGTDPVLVGDLNDNSDTIDGALERKINEPSNEGTNGQVLATDGNGGRFWKSVEGGSLPVGTNNGDILIWDATEQEWVAKKPSRLPSIYKEVEYISSDGTGQYINLNFVPTANTKIIFKVKNFSGANNYCFGQAEAFGDWLMSVQTGGGSTYFFIYGDSNFQNTNITADNNIHTFELSNGSQKVDNVEYGTFPASRFPSSSTSSFIIFGRTYNGSIQATGHYDIIEILRYEGNTLAGYFVPCRRIIDDESGVINLINNEFFGNAGTGIITHGPDVN